MALNEKVSREQYEAHVAETTKFFQSFLKLYNDIKVDRQALLAEVENKALYFIGRATAMERQTG